MIASILLAAQLGSGQLPPAQPIPPPDFETANVLAPIQSLFAAFEAGDSAAVLRLTFPQGRVTATGERASGNGLRQMSWTEFAQRVTPDAQLGREGFRILRIAARDVLGDMDAVLCFIVANCSEVGPLHQPAAGPPPRFGEELR